MTLLRALPFVIATLAVPCSAHATDPAIVKKAQVLFEAGLAAEYSGDCTSAVRLFQESLDTYRSPTLGALFHIALCEQMLGKSAAAYLHFGEFLRGVKERDSRAKDAGEAMAEMMKAGPWICIVGHESLPPNAKIFIDGVSVGPIPKDACFPAEPGDHVVVVKIPKQPDQRFPVYVPKGGRHEVNLRPRIAVTDSPKRPLKPVGFAIGGMGMVTIAAGAVAGIVATSKHSGLKSDCGSDPQNCALEPDLLQERKDSGLAWANASTGMFIAGGVVAAVGTLFVVLPAKKTTDVAIAPLFLPSGGGLSYFARF